MATMTNKSTKSGECRSAQSGGPDRQRSGAEDIVKDESLAPFDDGEAGG